MVRFGQVVVGTAGSGKTTYCRALSTVLPALKRHTIVINLDAANDAHLPYTAAASVAELLDRSAEAKAAYSTLGPNGAVMYTMELLEHNLAWLDHIVRASPPRSYFVFDCPGQLELYTHHTSLSRIFEHLQRVLDVRLCAVHLVDSVLCADASTYISGVLTSLTAMLNLALPHVNVLTKADLLPTYGALPFDLTYMLEGQDLGYLAHAVGSDKRFAEKYGKLTEAICEVIEGYSLVGFVLMSVTNATSVNTVLALADKANGYSMSGIDPTDNPAFVLQATQIFNTPLGELGEQQGQMLLEAIQESYDVHEAALESQKYCEEHPDEYNSDDDEDDKPQQTPPHRTQQEQEQGEADGGGNTEEDDIGQPPALEYTDGSRA